MDELSEALNGLLKNPEQLAAMRKMAEELLGEAPQSAPPTAPLSGEPRSLSSPGTAADGSPGGGKGPSGNKAELIRALSPWLSPERRAKLNKALRLARALRLATAAWERFGGESDV